jgi:hypothetical protein
VDADEVIVRIAATPESGSDGPRLADEILAAVSKITDGAEGTNGSGDAREARGSDDDDPSKVAHTGAGGWSSGNPT